MFSAHLSTKIRKKLESLNRFILSRTLLQIFELFIFSVFNILFVIVGTKGLLYLNKPDGISGFYASSGFVFSLICTALYYLQKR